MTHSHVASFANGFSLTKAMNWPVPLVYKTLKCNVEPLIVSATALFGGWLAVSAVQ